MRFGVLGPLEVWDGGRRVQLGGPQQRALLAVLLLNANRVVSVDRLVEYLWDEEPPPTARSLLHGVVAQLRRALRTPAGERDRQPLLTRPPGYLLEVLPGELDLDRFEQLEETATRSLALRSTAALENAAALLREALSLWRGPALDDVTLDAFLADAIRLEERRLGVLEKRIDADLRLGRHAELVGELQAQVRAHPLRERLWAQLILALHGAGRQADALAAYRELRELLVEQLGVEPGATLQQLERAILAGADPLEAYLEQLGTPVGPAGRESSAGAPEPAGGAEAPPDAAEAAPDGAERAVAVVPAQLPAAISSFTGRAGHLAQLDTLLEEADGVPAVMISAIAGTAGVGKTALAVHWAHRVRDRFGDGQLYVNLRGYAEAPPLRPVEALAGFLRALGVPAQEVPTEPDEAAGLYRTLLAGKRVLVVLDNARSVEQVRPLLPGSPGCLVLVTSRDLLGGLVAREGARHLALDVLTPREAGALLARILGPERVEAEPRAAAELARLCGYLPLALRIAAANLTLDPERGLGEHAAELARGDRLAALAVAGDEQAAVRAAFDLSYHTLEEETRRWFRLLGLVPGPDVTAQAAAALAGGTTERAGVLLARLADAHLLTAQAPGRYAFHDLLRLYAAERTAVQDGAGERDAATRRLLGWYLRAADAAAQLLYPQMLRLPLPAAPERPDGPAAVFDDPAHALAWLDAERPSLVAAVRHAAVHGPREIAWLLADALRGYFGLRRHTVDWLATAHAGLEAAEADGDLRGQAASQLSLADAYNRQSQYQQAIQHYTRAVGLNRETGWLVGQSTVLGNLGGVYLELGQLEQAADHITQALEIDRRTGWLAGQAVRLNNLGNVYLELGRLEQAADHITQALEIDRRTGWLPGQAVRLGYLGEICHALGRLEPALDHLTQALALVKEAGNRGAEAEILRVLAAVHCDAGRPAYALEFAEAAVAMAGDTGDRRFEADARNTLGAVHRCLARYQQAADDHQQALALARQARTRLPEAWAQTGLAASYRRLDEPERALAHARLALTVARQGGFRVVEGQALTVLAQLQLDQGRPEEAGEQARQALAVHQETGHRLGEARTLLLLGQALPGGERQRAVAHWRDALAMLSEIGAPEAAQARTLLQQAADG